MADQDTSMELLIFSLNGMKFCLDASQITGMVDPVYVERIDDDSNESRRIFHGGAEIPVVELSRKIGLGCEVTYQSPKVVLLETGGALFGVLIGSPEGMVSVTAEDIELLPEMIERAGAGPGVWGIAKGDDHLMILIDLLEVVENLGTAT